MTFSLYAEFLYLLKKKLKHYLPIYEYLSLFCLLKETESQESEKKSKIFIGIMFVSIKFVEIIIFSFILNFEFIIEYIPNPL